jgi:DNA-binding response OmpR family regulator
MKDAKILLIEGRHTEVPSFAPELQKKGFEVVLAQSGGEAAKRLEKIAPHLAVVNAASLRSSGVRICQSLREKDSKLPIILIVTEDVQVEKEVADAILSLPFTAQKLVNRINTHLPSDGKNVIHVGPIRLDIEHRRVKCLSKNSKITPRLITLLRILLDHHGEVVERDTLFKRGWDTNYTGDTRTLDVHVSWLRRAIEIDPTSPRFLKTIRGVGYRLDV